MDPGLRPSPAPPASRWRLALRVVLAAAVLAACVWFVRGLGIRGLGAAMSSASLWWVAAAGALNLVETVFRAALVRTLLAPVAAIPLWHLVRYSLTCFAANNLFPARAGELVRIYLLRAREGVPAAAGLAVALVEKALDLVAMLLVLGPLPLVLPGLPRGVTLAIELLFAAGAAGVAVAWIVLRASRGRGARWLRRFSEGMQVLRSFRLGAQALGLAVLVWVVDAFKIWLVLQAFAIHLHWAAPLLVLLVLNIAIAVPSTPAQLGPFEAAVVAALALLGVPAERALAFALVYHGIQAIPVTLLGAPGLRLIRAAAEVEPAPELAPTLPPAG